MLSTAVCQILLKTMQLMFAADSQAEVAAGCSASVLTIRVLTGSRLNPSPFGSLFESSGFREKAVIL